MRPPVAGRFGEKNKVRDGLGRVAMKKQEVISIRFSRLPKVDETPGLVTLAIASDGAAPPRRLGALTDVAPSVAAMRGPDDATPSTPTAASKKFTFQP